ncbi:MAG: M20/M25/M40 family metallo-hydrolase [Acidobacteriota bacterium]|jgi:acetylornithine deacetylase/succinyl-diaminopimelate desuccinylase-like protein|nr:M20/M25/M40 family metallo-hydrolase [Acidobacteriota bacterium]
MTTSTHSELELDAIRICRELIQIPSVNYGDGKGDEKDVAEYVVKQLSEVGIESKIYESAPGRCNVIARIKGSNPDRPGLVVHGHIDVVPANAADWSVDPFSAELKDGYIWGRGAVDMKNMDAMILATVRSWARSGYVPERDIVLAFFADEEAGSIYGSHYMVKNHPEVFAGCTEAVSEVGGFSVTVSGGKRLYLIETAEKGIHWMRLTAHGRAGHGSVMNDENALTRLTEAVSKIGNYTWPQRYSKTVKAFFKRVADETGKPYDEANLQPLLQEVGFAARMIGATLQNTANPTMLEAGYKANVIPGSASAVIDGRFIPGFEDELNSTIKSLIGEHITVETITRDKALEVPFEGDLVEAMCNALIKEDAVAIPVPYVMSGGTDNKALADLGIIGYGFSPLKLDADFDFMAMFHGVDERVPVEGLTFGARVLKDFLENV